MNRSARRGFGSNLAALLSDHALLAPREMMGHKVLLRQHGYPPYEQAEAVVVVMVIEQAERVCKDWARAA